MFFNILSSKVEAKRGGISGGGFFGYERLIRLGSCVLSDFEDFQPENLAKISTMYLINRK